MHDCNEPHDRIPDWVLAQYRLGELPEERAEALRRQLETNPGLAARLASLDEQEAELMRRTPPRTMAAVVEQRVEENPARLKLRRALWLTAELAAVALLLVLALPPFMHSDDALEDASSVTEAVADEQPATGDQPTVRDKGVEPYIRIFEKLGNGLEEREPGDQVVAGDLLQLHYASLGRDYGMVVSIDGDGAVTVHLPARGDVFAPLEPEGTVALPFAYELDHAHGFERFFLVTTTEPARIEPVIQAAHDLLADPAHARTADLALPKGLEQSSFLLLKPAEG